MRKLIVFESVTLDGYFSGPGGDLGWAYAFRTPAEARKGADPEFQKFVQGNASSGGVLLFGRVTYQMMESYWPTPAAAENDPVVARGMNEAEKLVFSRKLRKAGWSNTALVSEEPAEAVRKLKRQPGKDLVVLGSGSIVAQLAEAGLVDDYQFVVKPVALGGGRTLFEGVRTPQLFELTGSRAFSD